GQFEEQLQTAGGSAPRQRVCRALDDAPLQLVGQRGVDRSARNPRTQPAHQRIRGDRNVYQVLDVVAILHHRRPHLLQDRGEPHEEFALEHAHWQLFDHPLRAAWSSAHGLGHRALAPRNDRGHRTTTWCAAERNSECWSRRMTSLAAPMRCPVRRSYSNSSNSSTRSTPSTVSSSCVTTAALMSTSNGQPTPSSPPTSGLMKRVSASMARCRTSAAGRPGPAWTSATAETPWEYGGPPAREVPTSRCASRCSVMRRNNGAGMAKSSITCWAASPRTAGTTSSRTEPLPRPDGRQRARMTSFDA